MKMKTTTPELLFIFYMKGGPSVSLLARNKENPPQTPLSETRSWDLSRAAKKK